MRLFALALALIVAAEPAGARTSARARVQPAVMDATHEMVPRAWEPEQQILVRPQRPARARATVPGAYGAMVARHAQAHGLPESLVHRVIVRESRYNAGVVSKGNYGLMQIRLGTARAMGYRGSAAGLLDPEVNMTYAVKYLAGAYRVAGGNPDRAVANYARGYSERGSRARVQVAQAQRPGYAAYASAVPVAGPADTFGGMWEKHRVF